MFKYVKTETYYIWYIIIYIYIYIICWNTFTAWTGAKPFLRTSYHTAKQHFRQQEQKTEKSIPTQEIATAHPNWGSSLFGKSSRKRGLELWYIIITDFTVPNLSGWLNIIKYIRNYRRKFRSQTSDLWTDDDRYSGEKSERREKSGEKTAEKSERERESE